MYGNLDLKAVKSIAKLRKHLENFAFKKTEVMRIIDKLKNPEASFSAKNKRHVNINSVSGNTENISNDSSASTPSPLATELRC